MRRNKIITGLDIGSNIIKVAVAQIDGNDNSLQIIGVAENPSNGIINGNIVSIEDVVSSISSTFEKVERIIGMPIEHAVVGISGPSVKSINSQGVIAVAKADGEIKFEDIDRVLEAAQTIAAPPNYEILHVIPRHYKVDNQDDVKDPVGMNGVRLEVNAQVIMTLSYQIKTITKCIYRTGVDIKDLVFSILADAESVLSKEQKELGTILINIGAATTGIAIFEEGDPIHIAVLPIGSSHITNDLAIGLRTSIKTAEQIKINEATCILNQVRKRDDVDLSFYDEEEKKTLIPRSEIIKITRARVEEIFDMVSKELKKIERFGMLPAGVVLTGGGSKLNGIVDLAKEQLKLPAFLAKPTMVSSISDKIHDISYSNVLGLILWEMKNGGHKTIGTSFDGSGGIASKFKKLFKSIIP